MTADPFVDYYEALQISPNAASDTIHRIYRILAQRYHPDNRESGSVEAFRALSDAYHVLGDPEKRAAYDVAHREARKLAWRIFDQPSSAQGVTAERRKREGVLSALYRKRLVQPEHPSLNLKELEDLLGVPREHLEFTLWYLKDGQYLQRTDNARFVITIKGVDLAETLLAERSEPSSQPLAYLDHAFMRA